MKIYPSEWRALIHNQCWPVPESIERTAHLLWYLCDRQAKLNRHMDKFAHPIENIPYCTYSEDSLIAALGAIDTPAELTGAVRALVKAGYIYIANTPIPNCWNIWFDCDLLLARLFELRKNQAPKRALSFLLPFKQFLIGQG